jgi:hypothetical protein
MIVPTSYLASVKTNRCGVIPYTVVGDESGRDIYFLLARHKRTKELGDLGGGVRKTEFALTAGAREFFEESKGIFYESYPSANDMLNTFSIIEGKNMAIIFLPLDQKWLHIAQDRFMDIVPTKKALDEVSELVWVTETQFMNLVFLGYKLPSNKKFHRDEILWTKIQNFFQRTRKSLLSLREYIKDDNKMRVAA